MKLQKTQTKLSFTVHRIIKDILNSIEISAESPHKVGPPVNSTILKYIHKKIYNESSALESAQHKQNGVGDPACSHMELLEYQKNSLYNNKQSVQKS